jgi:hypothetical protein
VHCEYQGWWVACALRSSTEEIELREVKRCEERRTVYRVKNKLHHSNNHVF